MAYSLDEDGAGLSSQNNEEFHRNVVPKKNNLTDVLSLLKDGRSNSPEQEDEDDQGQVASSDEHLAPISKPWEFDGINKRKFKLTTKQLRRMFSPRKLSGHPTNSRSSQRASESTDDLISFDSEDSDEWINESVQAPEPRDSWRAPGSREEQRLLRVTNDDLQETCLRGDGLVKQLIAANASVTAPMRPQDAAEFVTLLHVLARKPHMQNCSSMFAEMVRNKANLNERSNMTRSPFGTTPLSLACHAKHIEAVEVYSTLWSAKVHDLCKSQPKARKAPHRRDRNVHPRQAVTVCLAEKEPFAMLGLDFWKRQEANRNNPLTRSPFERISMWKSNAN